MPKRTTPRPRPVRDQDLTRAWALKYVAPVGSLIQYLADRVRFHHRNGRRTDVRGGQRTAPQLLGTPLPRDPSRREAAIDRLARREVPRR